MSITMKYLDMRTNKITDFTGKLYTVSLPIVDSIPALRYEILVVHKNVDESPGWTVSHLDTGASIVSARTKNLAIKYAQDRLLGFGNEKFVRAINHARQVIQDAL